MDWQMCRAARLRKPTDGVLRRKLKVAISLEQPRHGVRLQRYQRTHSSVLLLRGVTRAAAAVAAKPFTAAALTAAAVLATRWKRPRGLHLRGQQILPGSNRKLVA